MTTYYNQKDHEWVQPARKNYKIKCCDCGLVHTIDFRLVKTGLAQRIQFKACRDEEETRRARHQTGDFLDPIEAIKFRMEQQQVTQADLVRAGCGNPSHVSEMLNRKRKLTLRFIRAYHKICDTTPLWVLIQEYKL